jgi:hypothetical protein
MSKCLFLFMVRVHYGVVGTFDQLICSRIEDDGASTVNCQLLWQRKIEL